MSTNERTENALEQKERWPRGVKEPVDSEPISDERPDDLKKTLVQETSARESGNKEEPRSIKDLVFFLVNWVLENVQIREPIEPRPRPDFKTLQPITPKPTPDRTTWALWATAGVAIGAFLTIRRAMVLGEG